MFGFIKRKIREFTDSFKEEADEEPVPVTSVEASGVHDAALSEIPDDHEDHILEQAGDGVPVARETDALASPSEDSQAPHRQRDPARTVSVRERIRETEPRETEHTGVREPSSHKPSAHARAESRPARTPEPYVSRERDSEPELGESAEPDRPEDAQLDAARSEPKPTRPEAMPAQTPSSTRAALAEPDRPAQKPRGFGKLMGALTKRSLTDEQFERIFTDLEIGLLEANTAYDAVQAVKENLRTQLTGERVSRFSAADDVARALIESITALFEEPEDLVALADEHTPLVIMLIGINGSGKTTTAAKLARAYQRAGKRPVLAAADTFRAAAIQQLEAHAKALDCRIIKHDYGADPTAVAYDALAHAKSGKADVVLIDTAGRLHSNENLLKELEKLKRIIKPHRIIFVGESIAGNDLLEQAQTFNEKIGIDGIILTKTDVDESGGGMLSVSHVTGKPIDYLGGGQGYDDLTFFSRDVVARLLGLE